MLTEQQFQTGDMAINYADDPTASAPLVLLHGLALRWQDLWPLVLPLSAEWHLYAPDFRGHGKSGRAAAPTDYHYTDYVKDTVAFLREVVKEPAVLVGHSLGALIALGTAAAAPESVRALILLDPPFHSRNTRMVDAPAYGWFRWVEETARTTHSPEALMEKSRGMMQGAPEQAVQGMADTLAGVDP